MHEPVHCEMRQHREDVLDGHHATAVDVLGAAILEDQAEFGGHRRRAVAFAVLDVAVKDHRSVRGELGNQHAALSVWRGARHLAGNGEPASARRFVRGEVASRFECGQIEADVLDVAVCGGFPANGHPAVVL